MKKRHVFYLISLFICLSFVLSGCTTMQSPKVLKPGEKLAGGSIFLSVYEISGFEVFGRFGMTENADIGFRAAFHTQYTAIGIATDVKYQILRRPFYLAADLELSMARQSHFDDTVDYYYGITPLILFGGDHLYCGFKTAFAIYKSAYFYAYRPNHWILINTDDWIFNFCPVVVLGCSIGKNFRVVPEISMYIKETGYPFLFPNKYLVIAALGFQYVYRRSESR